MVYAKIAGPPKFKPITNKDMVVNVVLVSDPRGVDFQKLTAHHSSGADQQKAVWEFIPPLPKPNPIDPKLEKDVQIQRVFFKYVEKKGDTIEVSVDAPPFMKYVLDFSTGNVLSISPWRTSEPF